jgi:hypothetical protein
MAAPAGVNEGSAAEPVDPEPPGLAAAEAEQVGADPVSAEPAGTEPVAAEPAGTEPVAAEPAGTEPVATGSAAAGPAGTEPQAAGPVAGLEPTGEEPVTPESTAARLPVLEPPGAEWMEPAASAGEGRRRGGLGAAALLVGVIVLVGAAAGALAVVTHGFHRKTEVTYRQAAVFSLRPGDCVNFGPNGQSVTVLSCATPHDAEVFATFPLPASRWPGGAAVQQDASNGCASRLGGYLNPQLANAGLDQEFFYPDQTAWQAGARTVVCEVRAPTGQLTGSVRNVS